MRTHQPTSIAAIVVSFLACCILHSTNASAGQIAVDDLVPSEKVQPEVAKSLTTDLLKALYQVPDLAILSRFDIEAALERNPTLRPADCQPEQCFIETSSNFASEFLLRGTLGRLGRKWIASLTLMHLETNQIVRQSTGARTGDDSAAKEAVQNAVRNLFREQIPVHLQGPRSLSRLGFQAATAGFAKIVRTPGQHAKSNRKRIILDLITTELEYDVAPKIDVLDSISRQEIAQLKLESYLAPSHDIFLHHLKAQQIWRSIREDLNRVREIRAEPAPVSNQARARFALKRP